MRRALALLFLVVFATQAIAAVAFVAPSASAQECQADAGDDCTSDAPFEACPPVCTHCPCCFAAQIYLPEVVMGMTLLHDSGPIATVPVEIPAWIRSDEIFHIPERS